MTAARCTFRAWVNLFYPIFHLIPSTLILTIHFYLQLHNLCTIVRLNKKIYDARRFERGGFRHEDLFFTDGSTPNDDIVDRSVQIQKSPDNRTMLHTTLLFTQN